MIQANNIKYKKFIQGKRVVFVGPSPCILGEANGELIDSFDVVIRTNGAFPVNRDIEIDYGRRCDSLYVNGLYAREINLPIQDYINRGLSYLNMKEDKKNIRGRYKNKPLQIRDIRNGFTRSSRDIGAPPLMGSYIIWEILQMNPKSLYLTGMDCYSNPNLDKHYIDGYLPSACNVKKLDTTRINAHKQEIQNNYIRRNVLNNNIEVDKHILNALKV